MKQKTITQLSITGISLIIFHFLIDILFIPMLGINRSEYNSLIYIIYLFPNYLFPFLGWSLILPFFLNLYKQQRLTTKKVEITFLFAIIGVSFIIIQKFIALIYPKPINFINYSTFSSEARSILCYSVYSGINMRLYIGYMLLLTFFISLFMKLKKNNLEYSTLLSIFGLIIFIIRDVNLFYGKPYQGQMFETTEVYVDVYIYSILSIIGFFMILLFFIAFVKQQK